MSRNDDTIPNECTYSWSAESDLPLQDFLTKYKPSMVQNDGKKPWIWVRGSNPKSKDTNVEEAVEEAAKLLEEVTEKVEAIKNDASIPVRSHKKTGAKSKKELREHVQAEATESLKEIAIRHGYVSGKWLIFASPEKVDTIWTNLATSLASGPLALTSAHLTKVATSPAEDNPNYQHVICVYVPNVYDKDEVTEVMKILLRNHGVSLSGVKSNLYTSLGIDSKHASGIPSTTWKNSALMDDKESKKLKDAFFAELASNKPAASDKPKSGTNDEAALVLTATGKVKPKLKKKVVDDPFVSDDDDIKADAGEENRKEEIQAKTAQAKPQPKKKVVDDTFGSDDDDAEEEAKRKAKVGKIKHKAVTSSKKRQISESDNGDLEEDEEERPKKRRSGKI